MRTTRTLFCLALSLTSAWPRLAAAETARIAPDFFTTLRAGDARQLRAALDGGASPMARDARGNTPLHLAAGYGDAASLRLLLDRGAEVNATNTAGSTALQRAAANYEKLALLVQRGANVNARDGFC